MKVVKIIDSEIKSGHGKKGKWSMSKVELDNGKEVNIFNPIEEGQEVEEYEYEGFTNYRPVKKQSSANTDIDKAFKIIYAQNKEILAALDTIASMMTDLAEKGSKEPEIDLSDIPFGGEEE